MYQWKKYAIPALLLSIVAVGAFLRWYHFSDWIHFELDQARDARVIDRVLAGDPLDLPLLGPKAGGTFLRLGPGFYWIEYAGALLFGGAVFGGAMAVAIASIASIPVFYFLSRRYLAVHLALALTCLFSVSVFLVMYGRFAWNPNFIPFFTLLGFYALLRAVDTDEVRQGYWLVVAALSLGMATHMHFLAFLALPTIAAVFLVCRRPRIQLKFWVMSVVAIVFLYSPMILNEIETGGLNTKEFFAALTEKSTKESHPITEKVFRTVSEFGLHGIVITTGFEGATFPNIVAKDGVFGSVCDSKCDKGKWFGVAGIVIFGLSVLSLIRLWMREKNTQKKDLLFLSLLWLLVTFFLFLPLSYGIAPRFFLLNAPLFFLLLGFLLQTVQDFLFGEKRYGKTVVIGVVLLFVALNAHFLKYRFGELARADNESVESAPDRILKERIRVTLKQQQLIVDFMSYRAGIDPVPIYMFSEPQHRRALKYLMEKRHLENDVLGFSGIYQQGVYFLVLRTRSDHEDALRKYLKDYVVGEKTPFGTLTVIELHPKEDSIKEERQDFSIPESNAPSKAPARYTLREFLERNGSVTVEEDDIEEEVE